MHETEKEYLDIGEERWGRVAERLRRLALYRNSKCVFVSPEAALKQVRLNVLTDGKVLVIPSGSLKKGFLKVDPRAVTPGRRPAAVDPRTGNPFASKIPYRSVLSPPIDLMVATARAVGRDGSRHGDGCGHLDLQYAILSELGWMAENVKLVAIVHESRVFSSLEVTDHDVDVHWIVTPCESIQTLSPRKPQGKIRWDLLNRRRIKTSDPLFYLSGHHLRDHPPPPRHTNES